MRHSGIGRFGMIFALLGLVGCDAEGERDAGGEDAGSVDAGALDAERPLDAPMDARALDAQAIDATRPDASMPDAAPTDRPVVTLTPGPATFTEGDGFLEIDPAVTVSDVGDSVTSALIELTPALAGEGIRLGASMPGLTIVQVTPHMIAITGDARPNDYQNVVRSLSFEMIGGGPMLDDPSTEARVLRYAAQDEDGWGPDAERALVIVAVNDPPVNTAPSSMGAALGAPVAVPGLYVSDPDLRDGALRVTLSASAGTLTAPMPSAGSVSGSGTDTVVLTGTLTPMRDALAAVTYTGAALGSATITMTSDDQGATPGPSASDADMIAVTVSAGAAPTLDTSACTNSYIEQRAAESVCSTLAPTGSAIQSATIVIEDPVAGDQLVLEPHGVFLASDIVGSGGTSITVTRGASAIDYEGRLRSVRFASASDAPGSGRVVRFSITDSSSRAASATYTLPITEQNDPPVITAPETITAAPLQASALPVSLVDPDVGDGDVTVLFQSSGGVFSAPLPTGGARVGDMTDELSLTGTLAAINEALALVSFTPLGTAEADVGITARDHGNSPAPEQLDAHTTHVAVPVATPPTIDGSATLLAFTEGGSSILLDDTVTVTGPGVLYGAVIRRVSSLNAGRIRLAPSGPFAASDISGDDTSQVVVQRNASAAEYQALLRTARWVSSADRFFGNEIVELRIRDQWIQEDTFETSIVITGVNDAPILTAPSAVVDGVYGTSAIVDGLGVDDPDSAVDPIEVTISSSPPGILTASVGGSATITGNGTSALTLRGQEGQLNITLAGLAFEPLAVGTTTLTLSVDDLGHNPGPALEDEATVSIDVSASTPPTLVTSSGATIVAEDAAASAIDPALVITSSATLTGATITLLDPEGADAIELSPSNGFASGDIAVSGATIEVTRRAPAASYEALLRTVTFRTSTQHPATTRAVSFSVTNGLASAADTKALSVLDTNDAPENVVPASRQTLAGEPIDFTGPNTISIVDVEAAPTDETVVLTPTGASLAVIASGGATVTPLADDALEIEGSLTDVNATLATLTLTPTATSGVSLEVATTDPGGLSDVDSVPVHIFPLSCTSSRYGGHRYFSCQIATDWGSAAGYCAARGTHLAIVSDAIESNFLMTDFPITPRWIGLEDNAIEGCFNWVDGVTSPPEMGATSPQIRPGGACPPAGGYQRWDLGEPNDGGGIEECVSVGTDADWDDESCFAARDFVCEAPRP